jgi:hypothetical protein
MRGKIMITGLLLAASVSWAGGAVAAEQTYGKGVSAPDTILVSELLASPAAHLGQTVRVEGTVVGVCKKRGCWVDLASDQPFQKITVKVDDGVIVFPPELMGQTLRAEGLLEAVPLSYENACAYLESEASCQGETFDKKSVPEEGITIYRIQGTGAVVTAAGKTEKAAG